MTPEQFIDGAVAQGARDGLHTLSKYQAFVFLISEAEVLCDMEGIDSFIGRYGPSGVLTCAAAFRAVGAISIADAMRSVGGCLPDCDDGLLDQANRIITDRAGYDHDAICRMVASHMT